MRQHVRLIAATALLVAALGFFGYRVYDYQRARRQRAVVADEHPVVAEARALHARGDPDKALALLSAAHRRDPSDETVALEYATVLYATANYEAAEQLVSQLLAADPGFARALALRGMIRRDSGRLEEGIADLEAAAAAATGADEVMFTYSLAHALLLRSARELELTPTAQADMARAAELLQRAVELAPDRLDILSDLASLQQQRSMFKEAIELYGKLADLLPQDPGPLYATAACYMSLNDPASAAVAARAALKRDPNCLEAATVLGLALHRLPADTVDEAEYEKALRTWWEQSEGSAHEPALWLAELHLRRGDRERAEEVLRAGVADEEAHRRPPSPPIHEQLGRLLIETGREQEGRAELAKAQDLRKTWKPVDRLVGYIEEKPAHSRDQRLEVARLYGELGWPEMGLPYLDPLLKSGREDPEAAALAEELRHAAD